MVKKSPLDAEEKQILRDYEAGKFRNVKDMGREIDMYATSAQNAFAKTRSISIRISERDFVNIKARAMREGMPYQTLISSVIHKEAEKV